MVEEGLQFFRRTPTDVRPSFHPTESLTMPRIADYAAVIDSSFKTQSGAGIEKSRRGQNCKRVQTTRGKV
jgi:hypothetical protein